MKLNQDVPERMASIRSIFETAKGLADLEANNSTLIYQLERTEINFRSVAFEGASMSRGLLSLSEGSTLDKWKKFAAITTSHAVQVAIGLGWAIAQRELAGLPLIQSLNKTAQARVLDGIGYYCGMFRHRSYVRDKLIPGVLTANDLRAFDEGLGRSLWYHYKGDTAKLLNAMDSFETERKANLFRGAGIAIAYVGGCSETIFRNIFEAAGNFQTDLSTGAIMLALARSQAGTTNSDADLACRVWCQLSAADAVSLMEKYRPSFSSEDPYFDWIAEIKNILAKSQ